MTLTRAWTYRADSLLYHTPTVRERRIASRHRAPLLSGCLAFCTLLPAHTTSIAPEVRVDGVRGAALEARVRKEVNDALQTQERWFGPAPFDAVTVVERGTEPREPQVAGAARLVVDVPWWAAADDRLLERRLIESTTRAYWSLSPEAPGRDWVREGLATYTATRLIHEQLEGRQFHTARLFGGLIPFVVRRVPTSSDLSEPQPYLRTFDAFDAARDAPRGEGSSDAGPQGRVAAALHTLERYVGWPAVQQALSDLSARRADVLSPRDLSTTFESVTGRDLAWFFEQALDPARVFDYAIADVRSQPITGGYRTTVVVRRVGNAVFSGTASAPVDGFDRGLGVVVAIAFDDETVLEQWDGRAEQREFVYESRSPVAWAYVDPDHVLLLDADRFNNGWRAQPGGVAIPARWSLTWMTWLQDLMLAVPGI